MKRSLAIVALVLVSAAGLGLAGNYASSLYFAAGHGNACASCHEMTANVSAIHGSPHHNATCTDCHDSSISTKLRHVADNATHRVPEQIHLREADVRAMVPRCQSCHQHEYASWHAGPHAATYSEIFTNPAHNAKRRLMDDCFRCHGMYFQGGIRDLVQQQNAAGPWRLTRPELAAEPAIPCQSCHWIHREGPGQGVHQAGSSNQTPPASQPIADSLAFFDRREEQHFRAISMTLPRLFNGPALLNASADPRQALCYQCHAPRQPETLTLAAQKHWGPQAGSGDDRTPTGVHEGLSCLACHNGHNESARASCATCHSGTSRCGINVEKMDTTFAGASSGHNIHSVKCADCHQSGIPRPRSVSRTEPVRGQ